MAATNKDRVEKTTIFFKEMALNLARLKTMREKNIKKKRREIAIPTKPLLEPVRGRMNRADRKTKKDKILNTPLKAKTADKTSAMTAER